MSKPRTHLASLQARAKRHQPQSRVIFVPVPVSDRDEESDVAAGPTELWLYGTVGGYWWGFSSDEVAEALREMGAVSEITVRLHSYGGDAFDGIAIANLLANHPARVRVVVDGVAASAATQIALAGEELIMSPGSQFMIHDAWMYTVGNAAELHAEADWLGKQSQNYAELYAHRAGGTAAEWRERMLADGGGGTWYTAAEAVEAGLASRVANITSTGTPPAMPEPADVDDVDAAVAAAYDLDVLLHPAARAALTRHTGAHQPPAASAPGSTTRTKETAMAFTPEHLTQMRQDLGLAETADEATIAAALSEALNERAETPAAAASLPEGMSIVSTDVLDELRTQAREGSEARAQQRTEARDRDIQSAVSTGRITPAQREHFATLYDADPEGTQSLLSTLAPGLVPVSELGHAGEPEASGDDHLYAALFGAEKKGA